MIEPATNEAYGRTLLGRFDARVLSHRAVRWGLIVALGAVLIVPSVQFVLKLRETTYSPIRGEMQRSALGRWLNDARALSAGEDPYGPGHWFPNPPLVLMALAPLARLPLTATGIVWAAGKAAATLGAMALIVGAVRRSYGRVPVGILLMCGLFGVRPVISDIQHGNLNLFVLLLVAAAWALFARGRDFGAGLMAALATVTKVTPALLIVYFVYKRAWRAAAGAAVGLVLLVVIVPAAALGPSRSVELHRAWFDMLAAPYVLHGYVTTDVINQSMPGVLTRWLSAGGLTTLEYIDAGESLTFGMERMARPTTMGGRAIIRGAGIALLALLAWLCRTPARERRDLRLLLEFSLVLLAMLLLSERTWKHHLVTLPVVYLVVWQTLACRPWSDRFTGAFVAGLVAQWLMLTGSTEGIVGEALADDLLDRGIVFVGLLLCFLQCAVLLRGVRAGSAAGQ